MVREGERERERGGGERENVRFCNLIRCGSLLFGPRAVIPRYRLACRQVGYCWFAAKRRFLHLFSSVAKLEMVNGMLPVWHPGHS